MKVINLAQKLQQHWRPFFSSDPSLVSQRSSTARTIWTRLVDGWYECNCWNKCSRFIYRKSEDIDVMKQKSYEKARANPGLVLLCKWQSRISFLWNRKQDKKRLRSGLIQSTSFCIFLCGLWCANFPVIYTVKLLFRSMSFEVDCRSVKVFRFEFLTLKHPILEHLPKFFLKKLVCLSLW